VYNLKFQKSSKIILIELPKNSQIIPKKFPKDSPKVFSRNSPKPNILKNIPQNSQKISD
jgi:hypothetical protein